MSKIESLAQALAYFICYPTDGIEIGGCSSQLIDIIRTQTEGNDNMQLAFDDYDKIFYD